MAEVSGIVVEDITGEGKRFTLTTHFIAGWVGGSAGIFVGHPIDTVKVQMQMKEVKTSFTGIVESIKQYGMTHGFLRGLSFPMLSQGVLCATFFAAYGPLMHFSRDRWAGVPETLRSFVAGCVGGAIQVLPGCPMEVVKCNLQARIAPGSKRYYRGPLDCLRAVYRQHGLRGCYRGFGTHMMRDTLAYGLYTSTEVYCLTVLTYMDTSHPLALGSFVAGGIAGCMSWICVQPLDVLKSRVQANDLRLGPREYMRYTAHIVRNEGWRALFKGGTMVLIRGFPVNGVTLPLYRYCEQWLNKYM